MKKKIKKPLIIVLIVVLSLICVIFAGMIIMGERSFSPNFVTVIKTYDNSALVDMDGAVVLSNQTANKNLFSGLQPGDKLLIINDGILLSYPGRTGCYFCLRLGHGDISDIPEKHLEQLRELGWLSR